MTELLKITQEELKDKRLTGLDDTPALSYVAMQARFDAHPDKNTEVINENARRQNENNSAISLKITDIEANLAKKQNLEEGKVLSSNDFTNEEKAKLLGIEEGANKYDDSALRRRTADVERRMTYVEYDVDRQEKEFVNCYGRINGNAREIAQNRNNIDINSSRISMCETNVSNKVDKIEGKGLSQRDFSDAEKKKLASIEEGANNYTLPAATESVLGGIRQGRFTKIAEDGKISIAEVEHIYGKPPEITTESKGNGVTVYRKNQLSYPDLYVVAPGPHSYTPPGKPPAKQEYYWNRLVNEKELAKKADTSYISSSFSNALKCRKEGTFITAEDVSPVEHQIKFKAESENLIPFPYLKGTETINGVTFTSGSDGTISASGTASEKAVFYLSKGLLLEKGTYTLGGCPENGSQDKYFITLDTNAYGSHIAMNDLGKAETKEIKSKCSADIAVVISAGQNADGLIFKPKLQKGSENKPYTPYAGDLSGVKIKRWGGSLIPENLFPQMFAPDEEGGFHSTEPVPVSKKYEIGLPGGTYTIEYDIKCPKDDNYRLCVYYSDGTKQFNIVASDGTYNHDRIVTNGKPVVSLGFFYSRSAVNDVSFKNLYMSAGTFVIKDSYREPESYSVLSDGSAEGIVSLSPCITLLSDTEGIFMSAEYSRDAELVIKKLEERIAALEGVKTNI